MLSLILGIPSYRVNYTRLDGVTNYLISFTSMLLLTDLSPNTTYTVVVEALTPDNDVFATTNPARFITGKIRTCNHFISCIVFVLQLTS